MIKVLLISTLTLLMMSCSSVPKSIDGEFKPVSLSQAKDSNMPMKVRWGGVVARVENQSDQSIIEVVAKPLSHAARPQEGDVSGGRFLAVVPQFIDPVIYEQGREVTFVGELIETIEGKIGETKYIYPVLKVSGHHLWKKRSEIKEVHHIGFSYWPPFPHRYYYYPHWPHYPKGKETKPNKDK